MFFDQNYLVFNILKRKRNNQYDRNTKTLIFFLFLVKFSLLLWRSIFSHIILLAQELSLLIWREKMYEQYPKHIKIKPENSSVLQCFHFFGNISNFCAILFQSQKTISDTFILVWFHSKFCSAVVKVWSSHCTNFYSTMKRQDIRITFIREWRTVIHFLKYQIASNIYCIE